jgi:peptide/nickel transport system ATP-binding protein/oligopeptide transport system ATP-binding protein
MDTTALFQIKGLRKHFSLGKKRVGGVVRNVELRAVDNLSFDIIEGETLGVVGESGSGKSTLGRCVMNLLSPTAGEIIYGGRDISKLSAREMKKLRAEMQMVFQNPRSSFNPKMSIGKCLRMVAQFYGMDGETGRRRIGELFELTNLGDDILSHRSNELSGGQLQRVALVRALIPSPRFIMADEAVSALDVSVQAQILNLFNDMKERFGLTILFVSHDLTIVEYICDRVMVLYLGAVMEMAGSEDMFADPRHPYTKSLIASKPRTYPWDERNAAAPEGEIPNATDIPDGCRFCTRCPEAALGLCDREEPPTVEVAPGHTVACHLYA